MKKVGRKPKESERKVLSTTIAVNLHALIDKYNDDTGLPKNRIVENALTMLFEAKGYLPTEKGVKKT